VDRFSRQRLLPGFGLTAVLVFELDEWNVADGAVKAE